MPSDHDDFDGRDDPDDRDDRDFLDDVDDFDDSEDEDEDEPGLPWPPPPSPPPPARRARRAGLLAVTAVVAALAGFGIVAAALHEPASSASPGAADGNSSPSPNSGAQNGGPQGQLSPLPLPGSGQQGTMEVGGKVLAVSATSITIGGPGQSVTAAVTAATRFTGTVGGISGVKVGDFVAVAITGTSGKLTADTIQDPASVP